MSVQAYDAIIETKYPISFRKSDAKRLGLAIKQRQSVVLVGMKRVGISNFLRFFLYHQGIATTYIQDRRQHLFISIDLNDLVERELFPFWTLTLKRIVDTVSTSSLPDPVKQKIESLFLESIQLHDLFVTIDSVRQSLVTLVSENIFPTMFFLRFDRVKDVITPAFFDNLQGLKDATHQKLSYVFTSFRTLNVLSPEVFSKASLSVFAQNMYIEPAQKKDTETIYDTYRKRYKLSLSTAIEQAIFDAVDGYVQYLQLSLISFHEQKPTVQNKSDLFHFLLSDERISLQSEELWESLTAKEQQVLRKVTKGMSISSEDKKDAAYLWDTGYIVEKNGMRTLFSPLFGSYLRQKEQHVSEKTSVEFTKKEHLLFQLLKEHIGEICEREKIIEHVWPEVEALGVSDWAIDRLVARVRSKLRKQKNSYELLTVKTRGFKLQTTS